MTTKSKVPQIRFKGFSEQWEETKLSEKAIITMGQSPASSTYNEQLIGLPLIQGNADCKDRKTAPRIFASQFTKECFINDIVMTVRAPVGYVSKSLHHACIGRGVCSIKSKEDGEFLFQFLINYENQWLKFSQGSTFTAVNSDDIKNLNLAIPNHNEQTKIGNYFQQLDKLIEQKEKKYQKLKQFKKAMLDKMFPKNGADTPEIRFKGFSAKWEEKRLEEIALIKTGYPFDSNKFDANGEYLVITNGNIQNDFSFVDNLLGNKINIEDKCSLTEYILNLNDILVTMDGTVGRVAKVIHEKQILAQRVGRIISLIDSDFVYYFLSIGDFFKKMKLISTGGTIKHISLNDISKYESYIPKDFEEQQKIGNYFQKLDKQIDLLQKELEKLKNIKKASLSKMFV